MRITTMRLLLAALVAIVAALGTIAISSAAESTATTGTTPTTTAPAPAPAKPRCAKPWQHNKFVRNHVLHHWVGGHGGDFHAVKATKRARLKAQKMRQCQRRNHNRVGLRKELHYYHRQQKIWRFYHYIDVITPYGEWAIPGYIPYRESGTSGWYNARNRGGCGGPGCIGAYQIGADHWNRGRVCYGLGYDPASQHICAGKVRRSEGIHAWVTA